MYSYSTNSAKNNTLTKNVGRAKQHFMMLSDIEGAFNNVKMSSILKSLSVSTISDNGISLGTFLKLAKENPIDITYKEIYNFRNRMQKGVCKRLYVSFIQVHCSYYVGLVYPYRDYQGKYFKLRI